MRIKATADRHALPLAVTTHAANHHGSKVALGQSPGGECAALQGGTAAAVRGTLLKTILFLITAHVPLVQVVSGFNLEIGINSRRRSEAT